MPGFYSLIETWFICFAPEGDASSESEDMKCTYPNKGIHVDQVKCSYDRKHILAILLASWFCSIVWSHVHRTQIGEKSYKNREPILRKITIQTPGSLRKAKHRELLRSGGTVFPIMENPEKLKCWEA